MKLAKRALLWAKQNKTALSFGVTTAAGSAMAAGETGGVDAAAIAAGIVAVGVTIAVVGNARLIMDLGVRAFRWVRSALS